MKPPSALPVFRFDDDTLDGGYIVDATDFCRQRLGAKDASCLKHYASIRGGVLPSYVMCPYGFTSYGPVALESGRVAITGVVATPRFDNPKERERAKSFPGVRVSRAAIIDSVSGMKRMDEEWGRIKDEARKKLPQALHELRKLNSIVKLNAEKLSGCSACAEPAGNISGAAQLMSNIFEVVEVLTNIEDMKQSVLEDDDFIAVFDLAYKAKKIYSVRAKIKPIHIRVTGDDDVGIRGSKKYFPIVLQVLLENAIKYGVKDSEIEVSVTRDENECIIAVSNRSSHEFDPIRCFERGRRYAAPETEGDGLGLYLVREVVEAHGGSVICNLRGDTAKFVARLPIY